MSLERVIRPLEPLRYAANEAPRATAARPGVLRDLWRELGEVNLLWAPFAGLAVAIVALGLGAGASAVFGRLVDRAEVVSDPPVGVACVEPGAHGYAHADYKTISFWPEPTR